MYTVTTKIIGFEYGIPIHFHFPQLLGRTGITTNVLFFACHRVTAQNTNNTNGIYIKFTKWWFQMSSDQSPGWLDCIGDYTTQLSTDYDKPW